MILRPSFTLGGIGRRHRLQRRGVRRQGRAGALPQSPRGEVLVERVGARLEGVRARGDARPQRQRRHHLLDRELRSDGRAHRRLDHRRAGDDPDRQGVPASCATPRCAVIREIGVETGGSNIQFAVNPKTGAHDRHRDEPARVAQLGAWRRRRPASPSPRSPPSWPSATRSTRSRTTSPARPRPASSRPSTTWSPRCRASPSRSSPAPTPTLGPQMKSVGEVMAIGRTFREALGKALRSLEIGRCGLRPGAACRRSTSCKRRIAAPTARIGCCSWPRRCAPGCRIDEAHHAHRDRPLVPRAACAASSHEDESLRGRGAGCSTIRRRWRARKRMGISDRRLADAGRRDRGRRAPGAPSSYGVRPVFKRVDTCAAEFEAHTPYLYSTYETARRRAAPSRARDRQEEDRHPRRRPQPHRPGHRVRLLLRPRRAWRCAKTGFETIMVNCNPETVSTDYDTSDRLYFEPLTLEDVLEIVDAEKPDGVIVQFGGQTPLRLAVPLQKAGVQAARHQRRRHRPRRGSRALRRAARRSSACARRAWGTAHGRRGGARRSPTASATR